MKTAIEGVAEIIIKALTGNTTDENVALAPVILPLASATAPLVAGVVGGAVKGAVESLKEGKR